MFEYGLLLALAAMGPVLLFATLIWGVLVRKRHAADEALSSSDRGAEMEREVESPSLVPDIAPMKIPIARYSGRA